MDVCFVCDVLVCVFCVCVCMCYTFGKGILRTLFHYYFFPFSVVTKFVLVIFIGESVKGVRKATIATHKGAMTEFMGVSSPYSYTLITHNTSNAACASPFSTSHTYLSYLPFSLRYERHICAFLFLLTPRHPKKGCQVGSIETQWGSSFCALLCSGVFL